MISRAIRYFSRLFDSLIFLLRSPVSLRVDVKNQRAIFLGKSVRIGFFGRLYVNDPQKGGKIFFGDNAWLGRNIEIQVSDSQQVQIGRRATLQDLCKVLGDVKIGAYSTLASNVFVSSGTHTYSAEPHLLVKHQDRLLPVASNPVSIGEDTWIGNNVFIKAGVSVGRGCVIGANSVVLKDLAPYGVFGGVPAKKLKDRLRFLPPNSFSFSEEIMRVYFYEGFDHETIDLKGLEVYGSSAKLAVRPGLATIEVFCTADDQGLFLNEIDFKVIAGKNSLTLLVTPVEGLPYSFVTFKKASGFKGMLYVASANTKH